VPGFLDIGVKLRRFAPVEAAIVAHDANPAVAQFLDAVDPR
jgi:hypothetical protein